MKEFLLNFNFFSHQINFNYRKKPSFFTNFSGGISFIYYLTIIGMILKYSNDLSKKANPQVNLSEQPNYFNISKNFSEIVKEILIFGEIQILTYEAELNITEINKNFQTSLIFHTGDIIKYLKVDNTNCTFKNEKYFSNENNIKFYTNNITYLCKLDQNTIFQNQIKEPNDLFLTFNNLTLINESSVDLNLQFSLNELEVYFTKKRSDFILHNNFIDWKEDLFYVYNSKNITANPAFENVLTYNLCELNTFDGLLFSYMKTDYIFQQESIYSKKEGFINDLLQVKFIISPKMKIFTRIYKNIADMFSKLGGFLNILNIIGRILVLNYNTKKFNLNIINRLFKLEDRFDVEPGNKFNGFKKNVDIENKKIPKKNINFSEKFQNNKKIFKKSNSNNFLDSSDLSDFNINNGLNNSDKMRELMLIEEFQNHNVKKDKRNLDKVNDQEKSDGNLSIKDENINKKIDEFILTRKKDKLRKRIVELSFKDTINSLICFNKCKSSKLLEKDKMYESAEIKIKGYLNVLKLMRMYENFENLKKIIFSKPQIMGFDFIKNRDYREIEKNKKENLKKLNIYYKDIVDSNEVYNEYDEKIIELLGKDIISVLNV